MLKLHRTDIPICQDTYGKTILLSVGGATYTEGGFSSSSAAVTAANNIWSIFGPVSNSTSPRPFGTAIIDGFDFDFEATVSNMVPFANQLRSLMDANTSKQWLLTAAPQCPYPDSADGAMLAGAVYFNIIWVQFYNNYCGGQSFVAGASTQNNFDFATWDNWAKTVSLNPDVKIMLGIPGSATAAGSGYTTGSALASIISYSKQYTSFAGVMIWDMSQVWSNSGFLNALVEDLGVVVTTLTATATVTSTMTTSVGTTLTTVTTTGTTTATATGAAPTNTGLVNQWNQCAGEGWDGGTVCVAPYVCTYLSVWYSQCE
jgi:chitinase